MGWCWFYALRIACLSLFVLASPGLEYKMTKIRKLVYFESVINFKVEYLLIKNCIHDF